MYRHSATVIMGAGSTTLPGGSIYAGADKNIYLKELHLFNTVAIVSSYDLVRLDTAGTKPAAITNEAPYDPNGDVGTATIHAAHTVGPTIDEFFERMVFGPVEGSGYILTFGGPGIVIPKGVANGIGIVLTGGTGQILDATFVWEE